MAQKKIILIVLLCCLAANAQVIAQGGNITPVNITHERQTTVWQGLVGNLVIVGPNQTNLTAGGGLINQTDVLIASPCTNPLISGTIIFSNSSSAPVGLVPGNLSQLDSFLNSATETGTETFPLTSTFTIGGILIAGVPTTNTYVNSHPQPISFREGYLNDASGNVIFASAVDLNTIGYNGTRYDYQALLALFANATTPYFASTDISVTCPGIPSGGGGRGGTGYYNATIQRFPELQTAQVPENETPEISEEEVNAIESLKPLQILAPEEITATVGQTLTTPLTIVNPNPKTAPFITVALRIPNIVDEITPLHTNPLFYALFGMLPLHGSTHIATFTPIAPTFNKIPSLQSLSLTISNKVPITHPAIFPGTIEVYAGNKLVATKPVTVHLVAPPFALEAEHDGNQVLILLLLNNEQRRARTTEVELDYNKGRTTPFAELYTLELAQNTVRLYGYTYKPEFAYDTIIATSDLGRKEAH